MTADVILLPSDLPPPPSPNHSIAVFDVLRATTSMVAALASGVSEIRIFDSIDAAQAASTSFSGPRLLCGECACLPPEGFDLGNSPAAFNESHCGRTLFMTTTNGTAAVLAASQYPAVFIATLVNASAVAAELAKRSAPATLLCAGTNGKVSMEDLIGAGAVLSALDHLTSLVLMSDTARLAILAFNSCRHDLVSALRNADGGRNLIQAGLADDIPFAADLDRFNLVPVVKQAPLRVVLP